MPEASLEQWLDRVARSRDIKQLVEVAQQFMSSLGDEHLAELPAACRRRVLITPIDLSDQAYDLKRAMEAVGTPRLDTVERAARFFSEAAARATTLSAGRQRIGGFSSTDLISYRKTKIR